MQRGERAGDIDVRRIRADEWPRLREIRLRALADAPTAFGDTVAAASGRPDEAWRVRAAANALGEESVLFVAEQDGRWLGLAGGLFAEEAPGVVELVSMWLEPAARGRGVAARLVDAVTDWARGRGADHLRLWVTEGNEAAIGLYLRSGFTFTGELAPLPSHPELREAQMARAVRANG